MSDWQPIDTAPKDGTEVILLLRHGGVMRAKFTALDSDTDSWVAVEGQAHPEDWDEAACWEFNSNDEESEQPTHWIPIPDLPSGVS